MVKDQIMPSIEEEEKSQTWVIVPTSDDSLHPFEIWDTLYGPEIISHHSTLRSLKLILN